MTPNLTDYAQTCRTFSWPKAQPPTPWFFQPPTATLKNKIALYWEGENGQTKKFTFGQISDRANQFAHLLKKLGVKKGDRVFFFLPRVSQLYWGLVGSLRIGAVVGTLFAAFGTQALQDRLANSGAKVLVTNKELLPRVKAIKSHLPDLQKIILADDLDREIAKEATAFPDVTLTDADPLCMLYTSATGNTPVSGIVTPRPALRQQMITAQWVLDLHPQDIYWCTADPGWVTGVAYGILAPWALANTLVVFEGRFAPGKWYEIIQKYQVSVLYTAPTAIRLLQDLEKIIKNYDLSALRLVATVGEALTPASFAWIEKYLKVPVLDTYWQTETGAMMICNFLTVPQKPGSMGKPIPGITAVVLDDHFQPVKAGVAGNLAFKPGWPGMMSQIWQNPQLYRSYFSHGWFLTGDRVYCDQQGYFWFSSRKTEIIKTAGERVGTFEVESAIASHPAVLENAVIGKPDPIRGEIIKAFIVLRSDHQPSAKIKTEIQTYVKTHLAGHAYPREIDFVAKLPKTRSGKIVRRMLKAQEMGLPVGDTSTLEE